MGEVRWPKKGSIPAEYHEALAKAVEAHAPGQNDYIDRMAQLAAENKDAVVEKHQEKLKEKLKEKRKSRDAAAAAAFATAPVAVAPVPVTFQLPTNIPVTTNDTLVTAEILTGLSNAVTSVPASDVVTRVNAMEVQGSNAATTQQEGIPFLTARPAVPIPTIQDTIPGTSLILQASNPRPTQIAHPSSTAPVGAPCFRKPDAVGLMLQQEVPQIPQDLLNTAVNVQGIDVPHVDPGAGTTAVPVLPRPATVVLPTKEQVSEIQKKVESNEQDEMKLKTDAEEIQGLENQLAAKKAKFLENQKRFLDAKTAVAKLIQNSQEMVQQKKNALEMQEATLAALEQRVGMKRKRDNEASGSAGV